MPSGSNRFLEHKQMQINTVNNWTQGLLTGTKEQSVEKSSTMCSYTWNYSCTNRSFTFDHFFKKVIGSRRISKSLLPLYVIFICFVGFVWGLDVVTLSNHSDVTLHITFASCSDVIRIGQDGPLVVELVFCDKCRKKKLLNWQNDNLRSIYSSYSLIGSKYNNLPGWE